MYKRKYSYTKEDMANYHLYCAIKKSDQLIVDNEKKLILIEKEKKSLDDELESVKIKLEETSKLYEHENRKLEQELILCKLREQKLIKKLKTTEEKLGEVLIVNDMEIRERELNEKIKIEKIKLREVQIVSEMEKYELLNKLKSSEAKNNKLDEKLKLYEMEKSDLLNKLKSCEAKNNKLDEKLKLYEMEKYELLNKLKSSEIGKHESGETLKLDKIETMIVQQLYILNTIQSCHLDLPYKKNVLHQQTQTLDPSFQNDITSSQDSLIQDDITSSQGSIGLGSQVSFALRNRWFTTLTSSTNLSTTCVEISSPSIDEKDSPGLIGSESASVIGGNRPSPPPGGKGPPLPPGGKGPASLLDAKKHSVSSSDLGLRPTSSENFYPSASESHTILRASSKPPSQNGMVKINAELLEKLVERRNKIDSDEFSCHISPDQEKTKETPTIRKTSCPRRNCISTAPTSAYESVPASESVPAYESVPASASPVFVLDPSKNPKLKHLMLSQEMSSDSDSNSAAASRPALPSGSMLGSSVCVVDPSENPKLTRSVQLFNPKIFSDSDSDSKSEFIF